MRSEGRLERNDSRSNIPPSNTTNNLPLVASLLAIPSSPFPPRPSLLALNHSWMGLNCGCLGGRSQLMFQRVPGTQKFQCRLKTTEKRTLTVVKLSHDNPFDEEMNQINIDGVLFKRGEIRRGAKGGPKRQQHTAHCYNTPTLPVLASFARPSRSACAPLSLRSSQVFKAARKKEAKLFHNRDPTAV